MPSPGLSRSDPDTPPRGIVLMLHGGAQTGLKPVGPGSASLRRTAAMRAVLEPRMREHDLSVWLLRFAVRGWNPDVGPEPSPLADTRWALDLALAEHPGVPVVMLGHSMGARAAVHLADHASVAGVVALAPWLEPHDPRHTLAGKHFIAGHGSRDRITSARRTRAYVRSLQGIASSAEFVDLGRVGHYMLHRPRAWNRFALGSTLEVLDRADADGREDRSTTAPAG